MNFNRTIPGFLGAAALYASIACGVVQVPDPDKDFSRAQSTPTPQAIYATPTPAPTPVPLTDPHCYFRSYISPDSKLVWGPEHSREIKYGESYFPQLTHCQAGQTDPDLLYQTAIATLYDGPTDQRGWITDKARQTIEQRLSDYLAQHPAWLGLSFPGGVMGNYAGFSVISQLNPITSTQEYQALVRDLTQIATLEKDIQ